MSRACHYAEVDNKRSMTCFILQVRCIPTALPELTVADLPLLCAVGHWHPHGAIFLLVRGKKKYQKAQLQLELLKDRGALLNPYVPIPGALSASYCGAGGADSSRPAGAGGRAMSPSAWRDLPLSEGKKEVSKSSTTT